ncbi:26726_t:CDS:1, partial [Dentiscutata erythropus]
TNPIEKDMAWIILGVSIIKSFAYLGDKEPNKVETLISFYLHWHEMMIEKNKIENIKKKLIKIIKELKNISACTDAKINEMIDGTIKTLENQKENLKSIIPDYKMDEMEELIEPLKYQIIKMKDIQVLVKEIDRIKTLENQKENLTSIIPDNKMDEIEKSIEPINKMNEVQDLVKNRKLPVRETWIQKIKKELEELEVHIRILIVKEKSKGLKKVYIKSKHNEIKNKLEEIKKQIEDLDSKENRMQEIKGQLDKLKKQKKIQQLLAIIMKYKTMKMTTYRK